jgi:hypothetical protein
MFNEKSPQSPFRVIYKIDFRNNICPKDVNSEIDFFSTVKTLNEL